MEARIEITKTDNAAFCCPESGAESPNARANEIVRILREVADKIERGMDSGVCRDINGNKVGEWFI